MTDKYEKLKKYTKEEIIEALSQMLWMEHSVNELLNQLSMNKFNRLHAKTNKVMEEWKEIVQKFDAFKVELKAKYGKERLGIRDMTREEIEKYVKFVNDDERAFKYWNQLQKEEDAYCEQMWHVKNDSGRKRRS